MKKWRISKAAGAKAAVVILLVAVLTAVNFAFGGLSVMTAGSGRLLPIYRVARDDNKVSISFDAAWGNEDTQELIDILARYDVKATFFVVGEWVDKYPESVLALFEAGHEIMSHSDTHPHMPQLSREGMQKEIKACADKIEQVTGVRPTLFRPPYGDYNNALIEVLGQEGEYAIQWDVETLQPV